MEEILKLFIVLLVIDLKCCWAGKLAIGEEGACAPAPQGWGSQHLLLLVPLATTAGTWLCFPSIHEQLQSCHRFQRQLTPAHSYQSFSD